MFSYHFLDLHNDEQAIGAWEKVVGTKNVLLSVAYLQALSQAPPSNLSLHFVGVKHQSGQFVGVALVQTFVYNSAHSFGEALENTCSLRWRLLRYFGENILVLGNNMISGENAFVWDEASIDLHTFYSLLIQAMDSLNVKGTTRTISLCKDFEQKNVTKLRPTLTPKGFISFEVQPSMVLSIQPEWHEMDAYLNDLSKKYRARIRTALSKLSDLRLQELSVDDCVAYQDQMYALYLHVAQTAEFNLFLLPVQHFSVLKKNMQERFRIYAYFQGAKMVGFFSFLVNGSVMDTYYLGYDPSLQKDYKLYFNFLIQMIQQALLLRLSKINFGRTALEIKSTLGAEPVRMQGFMKHHHPLVNWCLHKTLQRIYKPKEWIQRKPFKKDASASLV